MPSNSDLRDALQAVHDAAPVPSIDVLGFERRVRQARRRRTLQVGAAAVGAVAASVAVGVVVVAQGGDGARNNNSVATEPAPPPPPRLLRWDDAQGVVSLDNTDAALPGAPRAFTAFVESELRSVWQSELGGGPACRLSPQIDVDALRTDGYATGTVSQRPLPGCDSGGAYVAVWAVQDGAWKEVIGTQEVMACADLEDLGVPSDLGITQCFEGKSTVEYTHP